MKVKLLVCTAFLLLLCTSACAPEQEIISEVTNDAVSNTLGETGYSDQNDSVSPTKGNTDNSVPSGSDNTVPIQPSNSTPNVKRYDVYQWGATSLKPDKFSAAMADNPIDEKRAYESQNDGPGTTKEMVAFYSRYLQVWKDELSFSIDSLKTYLSDEESKQLDAAQEDWEKSLNSSFDFDMLIISNHEISLGSQFTYGRTIFLINQYEDRAIHIKYMTYLIESQMLYANKITESNQLWNVFHEFE